MLLTSVPGGLPASLRIRLAPHLRRDVRPLAFTVSSPRVVDAAETVLLDAAQNGTLDLPAYVVRAMLPLGA